MTTTQDNLAVLEQNELVELLRQVPEAVPHGAGVRGSGSTRDSGPTRPASTAWPPMAW
jgi:hypothetical protein